MCFSPRFFFVVVATHCIVWTSLWFTRIVAKWSKRKQQASYSLCVLYHKQPISWRDYINQSWTTMQVGWCTKKLPKLGSWHALLNSDFRGIYFDKITESKEMGIWFSHQGIFYSKPIFFQYQTLRVEVVSPKTDQPAIRRLWLGADFTVDGRLSPALWTAEGGPTDHAGCHSIATVWGTLGFISDCLGLRLQSHSVISSCYSVHAIKLSRICSIRRLRL